MLPNNRRGTAKGTPPPRGRADLARYPRGGRARTSARLRGGGQASSSATDAPKIVSELSTDASAGGGARGVSAKGARANARFLGERVERSARAAKAREPADAPGATASIFDASSAASDRARWASLAGILATSRALFSRRSRAGGESDALLLPPLALEGTPRRGGKGGGVMCGDAHAGVGDRAARPSRVLRYRGARRRERGRARVHRAARSARARSASAPNDEEETLFIGAADTGIAYVYECDPRNDASAPLGVAAPPVLNRPNFGGSKRGLRKIAKIARFPIAACK